MIDKLSDLLTGHLRTVVLGFAALGFVAVLAELVLMQHTDGKQLIALWACGLGTLLSLMGLVASGKSARVVAALLVVLAASGLMGTFFHLRGDDEEEARAPLMRMLAWVQSQGVARAEERSDPERREPEEGEHDEEGEGRPPLAPLSLSGLAMLAAAGVLARRPDAITPDP